MITRKPSIFSEDKKILTKFPYAIIILAILLIRISSSIPETITKKLFEIGFIKKNIARFMRVS